MFQENVDSITLNTDLIVGVSRDGGSNFSTVTLTDEGYTVGSSGQRILSGTVDISGQKDVIRNINEMETSISK